MRTIINNRKYKIFIAIIIFFVASIISTSVNAALYSVDWNPIRNARDVGNVIVYDDDEYARWFCGEKRGTLYDGTYDFTENAAFWIDKNQNSEYNYLSYIFSYFTDFENKTGNIFGGEQLKINDISDTNYRILQRLLWDSQNYIKTGNNKLLNNGGYYSITSGSDEYKWRQEGINYQKYIKTLKNTYGGDYSKSVTKNDEKAEVKVNSNENTITLGEYSIDYLHQYIEKSVINNNGKYVLFSGIKDIIVYNAATGERINNVKFINENGNIIGSNSAYKFPKSGEKFYIQIPYTENTSNIKIKVQFKYIDDIKSQFSRYGLNEYYILTCGNSSRYHDHDRYCYTLSTSIFQDLLKYHQTSIVWGQEKEIELGIIPPPGEWDLEIKKQSAYTQNPISARFRVNLYKSDENGKILGVIAGGDGETEGKWTTELANGRRIRTLKDLKGSGYIKIIIEETSTLNAYNSLDKAIEILVYKDPNEKNQITKYKISGPGKYNTNNWCYLTKNNEGLYVENNTEWLEIYNSDEAQKLVIDVDNEIKESVFAIKVNKGYGSKQLSNAKFNIVLKTSNNEIIREYNEATDRDGTIFIQFADSLTNGKYKLELNETKVPSGYKASYYGYLITFEINNGKVDEDTIEIKAKKYSSSKTYSTDISEDMVDVLYKNTQNKTGLDIYVENTRRSYGSSSSSYGFDVILNKILEDLSNGTTTSLQNIKFDIALYKNGSLVKELSDATASNGKLKIINNYKDTGNFKLKITEKLTVEQKNTNLIDTTGFTLNNNMYTKTYTIDFSSTTYTSGRNTYYYINSFKENDESIILEGPTNIQSGTDELLVTVKNKGEAPIAVTMNIAGTVFLDALTGKDGQTDNLFDGTDNPLDNIEVTLLDSSGNIIETVKTNENGEYEFIELNPMKQYRVKFTYNGQEYEDAEKFWNGTESLELKEATDNYTTEIWKQYSKAVESSNDRTVVNERFANIGDYPESYKSTNSLGYGLTTNAAYSKDVIGEMYDKIAEGTVPSNLSNEDKMMLQYIEDCKISAYTDLYPAFSIFSLSDESGKVWTINQSNGLYKEEALYDGQNQINLGLRLRPEVDLRISDIVEKIDVHVNDKQETYTYTELEDVIAYLRTFDIQRNTTEEDGIAYYNSADDLDIYVTHKIKITNESETAVEVKDFIDYYNKLYYTVYSIDGVFDSNGNRIGEGNNVYYNFNNDTYAAEKISINGKSLANGETEFVYVTLKLNGNGKANASEVLLEDANLLENGNIVAGKSTSNFNYVEISGYSTSTDVGLVDRDSIAGNFNPEAYEAEETYYVEDDTSGVITTFRTLEENYNSRTLSGNVFEDKRKNLSEQNKTIDTNPLNADSKISKIKGITVELVEIVDDAYITRAKTETDESGNYTFKNYIPGDYVLRFTYGDKTYEVDGNEVIYNGQHYQSTYANPNTNETKYWYTDSARYSDAYDKVQDRESVIGYANESLVSSDEGSGLSMNYYKSKLLKNEYDAMTDSEKQKMIAANKVEAYTSKIELEVESMITNESTVAKAIANPEYKISDVDFGLVKRAESKMVLEQHLSHITITNSDGSILVDTPVTIGTNIWGQPEIVLESGSDKVHFQNVGTKNSYGVGTAKLEIDDEILIGNIDLEYTMTVRNETPNETTLTYYKDGNNDTVAIGYYEEPSEKLVYWEDNGIRYYNEASTEIKTNIVRKEPEVVTTKVENIINYVSTNLNYDSLKNGEENSSWELISTPDDTLFNGVNNRKAVNNNGYKDYNQLLLSKDGNGLIGISLAPGNEVKETLVLSATNTQDVDLNYYNIAEILEIENSAGRVDTYSIPGNLEPGEEKDYLSGDVYSTGVLTTERQVNYKAYEPDSTQAEHVLITDTTGDTHYYYVLIGTVLVVFTAGIILIKKFVVDKKA